VAGTEQVTTWHAPSQAEISGEGDYAFVIDIQPDVIPYQAGVDGDALIRVNRPGWSWVIVDKRKRERKEKARPYFYMGTTESREAAIGEAMAQLGALRS
jgi:hypothetical protein